MICRTIQQLLLSSDRPDQPADDLRAHLAGCAICRAAQRRLVEAEQRIPLLPVPPSSRRDQFLQQVRQGTLLPQPTVTPSELWLGSHRPPPKERGLQKLAVSLALAASLAVFALGWWAWPHRATDKPPADPIVVRKIHLRQRLDQVRTPREGVEVLTDLARDLHREARELAHRSSPRELHVVARFYREVVREKLVEKAHLLPDAERPMLKGVVEHLRHVESELGGLASSELEPDTAARLREIAQVAHDSYSELNKLLPAAV